MSPNWHDEEDDTGEEWQQGRSWDADEEDDPDGELRDLAAEDDCLIQCLSCGSAMYDECEICPVCGEAVEHERAHYLDSKPRWFVALGTLGIIAVIIAILGSMF